MHICFHLWSNKDWEPISQTSSPPTPTPPPGLQMCCPLLVLPPNLTIPLLGFLLLSLVAAVPVLFIFFYIYSQIHWVLGLQQMLLGNPVLKYLPTYYTRLCKGWRVELMWGLSLQCLQQSLVRNECIHSRLNNYSKAKWASRPSRIIIREGRASCWC